MSILGHFPRGAGPRLGAWIVGVGVTLAIVTASPALQAAHVSDARPLANRSGDLIDYEPRPQASNELRACSFRHAVCVHAAGGTGRQAPAREHEVLGLLDGLDRAWDTATFALGLPPPDTDFAPDGALDVYLVDGTPYATRTLLDRRDPLGGFDRASAFVLVGRGVAPGCLLDVAAARVVARAILFGVAPATDEGSAIAESASLASLMVPCAAHRGEDLGFFQAHPELPISDTLAPPEEAVAASEVPLVQTPGEAFASGAALFYDWVDDAFGGYPGAIVTTMWAESPTRTRTDATRWTNEPDGYDVLRASFKGALTTGSTVNDLWLDFAVARAFVPGYPVREEWDIDWPSAPRTLASGVGVGPTGSAYVGIDCKGRSTGARLRVEARWEEHARMLWTLVRIDATGKEMSRVDVPGPDRGTTAQTTLVDLDGVARVLLVGTNAGDPLENVDPDDRISEPHGWVVSIANEPG